MIVVAGFIPAIDVFEEVAVVPKPRAACLIGWPAAHSRSPLIHRYWLRTLGIDVSDVNVRAALTSLAERNAPAFNTQNPDRTGVFYQSWAGVSSKTGVPSSVSLAACGGKLLMHPNTMDKLGTLMPSLVWSIVGHSGVDANDGLATVAGAKHGEFRGCIPADHMDEVGQVQDTYDPATGWDHLRFYRNVAFDLAARRY